MLCFIDAGDSITVSGYDRIRRQQLLREVEGYLDLITVFIDASSPSPANRDRIATRALNLLANLDTTGNETAISLYLHGQALRTMERYRDAVVPLRASAELEPENIHVWLALGWCYKRVRRLDLAIESLEDALVVDAASAIVHYNLACYWSLSHSVDQALHHLSVAFDIDPNYRDLVMSESDFDPIRSDSDFRFLTNAVV